MSPCRTPAPSVLCRGINVNFVAKRPRPCQSPLTSRRHFHLGRNSTISGSTPPDPLFTLGNIGGAYATVILDGMDMSGLGSAAKIGTAASDSRKHDKKISNSSRTFWTSYKPRRPDGKLAAMGPTVEGRERRYRRDETTSPSFTLTGRRPERPKKTTITPRQRRQRRDDRHSLAQGSSPPAGPRVPD